MLDEWVILQKMFVESKQIENTFTLWILFPFGSKCVGCSRYFMSNVCWQKMKTSNIKPEKNIKCKMLSHFGK